MMRIIIMIIIIIIMINIYIYIYKIIKNKPNKQSK